jgi:hypothetical protein
MGRRSIAAFAVAALAGALALGPAAPAKAGFWSDVKHAFGVAGQKTKETAHEVVRGTKHVARETADGASAAYDETREGLGEAAHNAREDGASLYRKVTE